MMDVGLRELRQRASELVKDAEAGKHITITVAGRPAAQLGPIADRRWRRWREIDEIFDLPRDADWRRDSDLVDHEARDPWMQR
jgi:prevent-host-death family protein